MPDEMERREAEMVIPNDGGGAALARGMEEQRREMDEQPLPLPPLESPAPPESTPPPAEPDSTP